MAESKQFQLDGSAANVELRAFCTGNLSDCRDGGDGTRYLGGEYDPFNEECVGLLCEDGVFEYRDIFTLQFVRYRVVNADDGALCSANWLHFQFVGADSILFALESAQIIFESRYKNGAGSIFPNHSGAPFLGRHRFAISVRFESPEPIECFDCDIARRSVYCGLRSGGILIGSASAPQSESAESKEEEEPLLLVEHCHSSTTTTVCGQLLGALISLGSDQTLKIWDVDAAKQTVSVLHSIALPATAGVSALCPLRCTLSGCELVAVGTVEGMVLLVLLDTAELVAILETDCPSAISSLSAMADGLILSAATLNGFVYLFDTVNFQRVAVQRLSAAPIVFAKYRKKDNDFMFIDYQGTFRVYPQTRPSTECTTERAGGTSARSMATEIPSVATPSSPALSAFTVNTTPDAARPPEATPDAVDPPEATPNVFSNSTIASNAKPLFQAIGRRKAAPPKTINPLRNRSVLEQIENPLNVHPKSMAFNASTEGAVSKFVRRQIESAENEHFDAAKAKQPEPLRSEKMQKAMKAVASTVNASPLGPFPAIPSKEDVLRKQTAKRNRKRSQQSAAIKAVDFEAPSIGPFIKRSLQPERRRKGEGRAVAMGPEPIENRKTMSFATRFAMTWSHCAMNRPLADRKRPK